jgi:hypothetical protein
MHTGHSRFKFLLVNEPIGAAINETCDSSAEFAHLSIQIFLFLELLWGRQTSAIFLLDSLRHFQQLADFLPDRSICLVHAQFLVPTPPFAAEARKAH